MTIGESVTPRPVEAEADRLVGGAQEFAGAVAAAVRAGDLPALTRLSVTSGSAEWAALAAFPGRNRWRDGSALRESLAVPPWCSAANALVRLGEAILLPGSREELVGAAAAHWSRAACTSVGGTDTIADPETFPPAVGDVVRVLRAGSTGPSAGFVALMAAQLVDGMPRVVRDVNLPVLVDRASRGAAASLRLALRASGPPGLHPDPARMPFLISDHAFTDAARTAWASSPLAGSGACVTWSLEEGSAPCNDVHGSSASVAVAVGLDELHRRRRPRAIRLRTLDPRRAVTGRLDDRRNVLPVGGYENKIEAAAAARLTVVLPTASRDTASNPLAKHRVTGLWAGFLAEAIALTRTRTDKIVATWLAVVLALAVTGVGAGLYAGQSERTARVAAERSRLSSDLAARATTLRQTDPRLAGLLGLEAQQLDPTNARAVDAIRNVIADNSAVARSWVASRSSLNGIAVDDPNKRVHTSGIEGTIRSWDLATGAPTGEYAAAAQLLRLNPSIPMLATEWEDTLSLFDVSEPAPRPLGTLPPAACAGPNSTVVELGFTTGGVALVAAWSDGAIATYDITTRQLLACRQLTALATPDLIGTNPSNRLLLAATVVLGEADDQVMVLLNTNRVLTIGLRSDTVTLEIDEDEVPGDATLIRASTDRIALGTAGGVLYWNRESKRSVAFPAGGIASPAAGMEIAYNQVAVAGPDGTVRLSGTASDINRDTSRPTGGAATLVGLGSDRTVVAGEAGGRVIVLSDEASIKPLRASTAARFVDDHTVLLADTSDGTTAYNLYTADIDGPPDSSFPAGQDYPHKTVYDIEGTVYVNAVDASPDFVAAATLTGRGGAVFVWDAAGRGGRELFLAPPDDATRSPRDRVMTHVDLVPEAGLLVARHVSGQVGFWSTRTWELLGTLDYPAGSSNMAVHGTRGVFVVNGPTRELVLVDLTTRTEIARVSAPDVGPVTWSHDGSRILALDPENKVEVFTADLHPTDEGWALPPGDLAIEITASPVRPQVAVVQGSRVRVYDLPTRTEAIPALEEPNRNQVMSVAWSSNGSTLAAQTKPPVRAAVRPGPVLLWRLDDLDWTRQICRITGSGLSRGEWDQYLGDAGTYVDRCAS